MDRKLTSPNHSSPIVSNLFSAALSIGAIIWAIGAVSGVATAQTADRPVTTETVSYADLDLSTGEGATALLKRLDRAAQRACGPEPSHSPLTPALTAHYDRCVREAVDLAVQRVASPLMTAMHTGASLSAGASMAAR